MVSIDVLIPVFKHEWLEETINSVLNQSFQDFKLILLSDGASEQANAILRKYSPHNKVEAHFQDNIGDDPSKKKLIEELSTAKFFTIFDDDDIMLKDTLKLIIVAFNQNPEAGIVQGGVDVIDEKGRKMGLNKPSDLIVDENFNLLGPYIPRKRIRLDLSVSNVVDMAYSFYAFSKEIYSKTTGWEGHPEYDYMGGDINMFLKMEEYSNIITIPNMLYLRRVHEKQHNLASSRTQKADLVKDLIQKARERRLKNNIYPKVLVGCPTSFHKEYCLDEYAESVKNLTYPNYDILIAENSEDDRYYNKIRKLLPTIKTKFFEKARDRIVYARNILKEKAIENYDYFLSLEQDVIPPENIIERLLQYNKKIVSGVTFHLTPDKDGKLTPLPLLAHYIKNEDLRMQYLTTHYVESSDHLERIDYCAMGCLLIHKDVLKQIKFRWGYNKLNNINFDDIYFCKDVKEKGFQVHVDLSSKCKHLLKGRKHSWEDIGE